MATRQVSILKTRGTRGVGNLNSLKVRTVSGGAKVIGADIDNFTLVELGFNADGDRTATQLSAVANKSYLIASPEVRNMGEELVDFYNAVGEFARVVYLDEGLRFDTSSFTLNAGVSAADEGQVAHFDPATKKFIISAAGTPHANYATAKAKFVVVNVETNIEYTVGAPLVRLEVTAS